MKTSNMDYEKKYKEALERARQIQNTPYTAHWDVMKEVVEDIFPELAESEDEKIRKELIQFFSDKDEEDYEGLHPRAQIVAWLENQGQVKESIISQHENKICKESDDSLTSENERIRKAMIDFFKHEREKGVTVLHYGVNIECMIAWLEKQGEHARFIEAIQVGDQVTKNEDGVLVNLSQLKRVAKPTEEYNITGIGSKNAQGKLGEMIKNLKPVNEVLVQKPSWSEEDENMIEAIEALCDDKIRFTEFQDVKEYTYTIKNWLKSLKDRVQPQQEWSKEDKAILEKCIGAVKVSCYSYSFKSEAENWLKSLRPQTTWKPSDEQVVALENILKYFQMLNAFGETIDRLKELEEQLKELKK